MPRKSAEKIAGTISGEGRKLAQRPQVAQGEEMPYERKWTRRKFIRSSAATAAVLPLAARSLRLRAATAPPPTCVFNPEREEGPYYVDRELLRSDITDGKVGLPLRVRITVVNATTCAPIPNAALDIWHCDAGGVYSGYTKINPGFGPSGGPGPGGRPPGSPPNGGPSGDDSPPGPAPNGGPGRLPEGGLGGPDGMPLKRRTTDDLVFLRGVQITDGQGTAEFKTIYPGHYPGRVNHIHMKVHIGGGATRPTEADSSHPGVEIYSGGHVVHTGQLFFPEDISRFVEATHPYSAHKIHRTTLDEDMVFNGEDGTGSVAKLTQVTSTQLSDGYVATLTVAVDPEATPKVVGFGGQPPRSR
jgi:protocatechuate 3,4-dioxygenase beta subunit